MPGESVGKAKVLPLICEKPVTALGSDEDTGQWGTSALYSQGGKEENWGFQSFVIWSSIIASAK